MFTRFLVAVVFLFSVVVTVQSQDVQYDTTINSRYVKHFKVPVTYYDYHVDGSDPDFGDRVTARWNQTGLSYGNYSGWADSNLTADGSPARSPTLPDTFLSISYNLGKLFKPWVAGTVDTFVWKIPPTIVDSADSNGLIVKSDTFPNPDTLMISDTMYKNIEIKDSMVFTWVINPITTDSMWLMGSTDKINPLADTGVRAADSGFGNEGDIQNAGYSFKMHNKITYNGEKQVFIGADDDAYLFINGKLAAELGGFHSITGQAFDLATQNLVVGQKYDLDLFFVERRMGGGIYFGGFSDYDSAGAVKVDTLYDTILTEKQVGILSRSEKSLSQKGTLLGLRIPPASRNVRLEYFSISGAKLVDREMALTLALVNKSVNLPQGMYLIRVTFLNAQGKRVSAGSSRYIAMRK